MPKYWVKNYFAHGRFPEVGQKQKTEKKKKKERLNNGDINGQATHGARKHAWRTQAAWANYRQFYNAASAVVCNFMINGLQKKYLPYQLPQQYNAFHTI